MKQIWYKTECTNYLHRTTSFTIFNLSQMKNVIFYTFQNMNSTSVTNYILKLEKVNEQLKELLTQVNREKVATLDELNDLKNQTLYDKTARVTQTCMNQGIVDRLLELGEMTSDFYKTAAYRQAADTISTLDYEVESGESVIHLRGIGKSIATKIDEYIDEQESEDEDFFISYNTGLCDALENYASHESDPYKRRAYENAAESIFSLGFEVTDGNELAQGPNKIPGIGKSIAKKINEFIETGKIRKSKKTVTFVPTSTNEEVAWALDALASLEAEPHGSQDKYRVRAYRHAADAIRNLDFEVTSGAELAQGPQKVDGIGKGIANKIDEFLQTGKITRMEELTC